MSVCQIVEIGAMVSGTGSSFATVVRPTCGSEPSAAAVHGISWEEMRHSPSFSVVFERFCAFLEYAEATAVATCDDSSDEDGDHTQPALPTPAFAPTIVLAAHNGKRFDGSVLVHECIRNGVPVAHLARYKWVDTMDVIRACSSTGCFKLQCLAKEMAARQGCAHRALDDVVALHDVISWVSEAISVPMPKLLLPFVCDFDVVASLVDIAASH